MNPPGIKCLLVLYFEFFFQDQVYKKKEFSEDLYRIIINERIVGNVEIQSNEFRWVY